MTESRRENIMNPSKSSTLQSDAELHLESLSALCDGELAADEARFLLRRLARDSELQDHWNGLNRVRACIQREYSGPVTLVDAVRLRLEDEPLPSRAEARLRPWLRAGIGGAIAASVALVAVVGLVNRVDPVAPGTGSAAVPDFVGQTTALDRQFSRRVEPAGFGGVGREVGVQQLSEQQRINRIMIRHSQVAGSNGFISFTPVLAAPALVEVEPSLATAAEPDPLDSAAQGEATQVRE
ncbi:MAG: hypothetical protein CVV18_05135 [Gammaproteobacteria bacterium HGW-Gammaproteobacteria-8]|nr:MAG: hypothetical protein CVV18_05135 [Gammaproteobacteria bacterium HGW-Gammaproteobacteria-8]